MPKLKIITATLTVDERPWKEFALLARSQGQTVSSFVRLMVSRELRKAAKEAAVDARLGVGHSGV